jgi:hypothetical protein
MLLSITDPATMEAAKEAADFLSTKDLKWWFAALFVLFVATGLFILKWLLASHQQYIGGLTAQLTEQRQASAAKDSQLLAYLKDDHLAGIQAQKDTAAALKELAEAVKEMKRS